MGDLLIAGDAGALVVERKLSHAIIKRQILE